MKIILLFDSKKLKLFSPNYSIFYKMNAGGKINQIKRNNNNNKHMIR